MIWSDVTISKNLHLLIDSGFRSQDLVNPASLDVRLGTEMKCEVDNQGKERTHGEILRAVDSRDIETVAPSQLKKFHKAILNRLPAFGDIIVLREYEVYWLTPGEMILISMLEVTSIPDDIGALFHLKSTRAREGYEHANAGWIDPGWPGVLTLEIKNNLRYNCIPIFAGLRIGQLVFHELTTRAGKPYSGRYRAADTVEPGKPRDYDVVR